MNRKIPNKMKEQKIYSRKLMLKKSKNKRLDKFLGVILDLTQVIYLLKFPCLSRYKKIKCLLRSSLILRSLNLMKLLKFLKMILKR